jgi:hypothetical protein
MEVLSFWFIDYNQQKLDEADIAHPFGDIRAAWGQTYYRGT